MTPTPDDITDDEPEPIDDREIACMAGHAEARRRLLASSRMDRDFVERYEHAVDSYEQFARGTLSEIRWMRDEDDDLTDG